MPDFIARVTNVPRVGSKGLYLVGEIFSADGVPASYLQNGWVEAIDTPPAATERISPVHDSADTKVITTKQIHKKGRKHEN